MTGSFARAMTPDAKGENRSMNVPSLLVQRCGCGAAVATGGECSSCRDKRVGMQRQKGRRGADAFEGTEAPAIVGTALASPGMPLDEKTRAAMETRTGRDFRGVRVHTEDRAADSARGVGASAYAVGRHVVFAPGRYSPHSAAGRDLLAHELTHVAQQDGLRRPTPGSVRIASSDSALERQAESAGRGAEGLAGASPASTSVVQRERGPDVRLDLEIHHNGHLSLKLADPDTPPLRSGAVSLRATPAGLFELTTPRASTRLDAGEVPRVLRDAIRRGGTPGSRVPVRLRVATCSAFQTPTGSRHLDFGEFHSLGERFLPLTPPLFTLLADGCRDRSTGPECAPEPAGEHPAGPVMEPRGGGLMRP
jgi:hypothetical protein